MVAIELSTQLGSIWQETYCDVIKTDDTETDQFMYTLISQLWDVFDSEKFFIPVKKKETLLRYRWGLKDGNIHSIQGTCNKYKVSVPYYVELEDLLLRQIGFVLKGKAEEDSLYVTSCIDNDDTRMAVTVKYFALTSGKELTDHQ